LVRTQPFSNQQEQFERDEAFTRADWPEIPPGGKLERRMPQLETMGVLGNFAC
jgi:hypothetical protein